MINCEKVMEGLVEVVTPRSPEGRVFVVGDLHGDYQLFMEKLVLLDFDREIDLVIAVGDLIDRSTDGGNLLCTSLLDEPWFKSIKGNHEEFCVLGAFDESIAQVHKDTRNGGAWFYRLEDEVRMGLVEKFNALPLAMEIDYKGHRYGFTHADMPLEVWEELKLIDNPRESINGRSIGDWLMWSRWGYETTHKDTYPIIGVRALFHGHTPTCGKLEVRGNEIYVDFGACFGYDLCVIELEDACSRFGL